MIKESIDEEGVNEGENGVKFERNEKIVCGDVKERMG